MTKRQTLSRAAITTVGTFYRLSTAAKLCGVPRTTIITAIEAGHIPVAYLADGLAVVRLEHVQTFAANRPARGPRGK